MSASDGARIAAIQERHNLQRKGIITAVQFAARVEREVAEVAAHHALMAAADALRAEAKHLTEAKTKGHVGAAKELTNAAGRVAAIAAKIPGALTAPITPWVARPDGCTCTIDARDGSIVDRKDGCPVHGTDEGQPVARAESPAAGPFGEASDPDGWMGPLPSGTDPTDKDGTEMSDVFGDPPQDEDRGVFGVPVLTDPDGTQTYGPYAPLPPAHPTAVRESPRIPGPRESAEVLQPAMVAGMDGQPVPALYIGETVTPPVPSTTDPFADPGGRLNTRRLTYGEFVSMAKTLRDEPSQYMSVTKVQGLGECGMRYAFGRLAKRGQVEPERPQWHNIGGNAFHAWAANVERYAWEHGTNPPVPDEEIETWWLAYLDIEVSLVTANTPYAIHDIRPSNRGLEGYDWWRVNGADMCRKYLAHHDQAFRDTWEVVTLGAEGPNQEARPALEVEYFLPISGDPKSLGGNALQAHGFMDVMRRHRTTGVVRIDDYKTGKSEGSPFQLGSYAHAARRVFGMAEPILVSNWLARDGRYTIPTEAMLHYSWDDLVYDYETAAAMDRQGLFVAHPTTFCGGCPFEAVCPKRYGQ